MDYSLRAVQRLYGVIGKSNRSTMMGTAGEQKEMLSPPPKLESDGTLLLKMPRSILAFTKVVRFV